MKKGKKVIINQYKEIIFEVTIILKKEVMAIKIKHY